MRKRALQTSRSAAQHAGLQGRISNVAETGKCFPLFAPDVAGKRWYRSGPLPINRYIAKIASNRKVGQRATADTKLQKTRHRNGDGFFVIRYQFLWYDSWSQHHWLPLQINKQTSSVVLMCIGNPSYRSSIFLWSTASHGHHSQQFPCGQPYRLPLGEGCRQGSHLYFDHIAPAHYLIILNEWIS